jgi:hypothetical protein
MDEGEYQQSYLMPEGDIKNMPHPWITLHQLFYYSEGCQRMLEKLPLLLDLKAYAEAWTTSKTRVPLYGIFWIHNGVIKNKLSDRSFTDFNTQSFNIRISILISWSRYFRSSLRIFDQTLCDLTNAGELYPFRCPFVGINRSPWRR